MQSPAGSARRVPRSRYVLCLISILFAAWLLFWFMEAFSPRAAAIARWEARLYDRSLEPPWAGRPGCWWGGDVARCRVGVLLPLVLIYPGGI